MGSYQLEEIIICPLCSSHTLFDVSKQFPKEQLALRAESVSDVAFRRRFSRGKQGCGRSDDATVSQGTLSRGGGQTSLLQVCRHTFFV